MKGSYTVIDSDGHVLEPPDLWERYTDPKYRDGCPKLIENGTQLRLKMTVYLTLNARQPLLPRTFARRLAAAISTSVGFGGLSNPLRR
jgi:uncharacterized protein